MSISEAHRKRFFEPGYVYIAGSVSEQILKIGVTTNTRTHYQKYLRSKKYGLIRDWIILYFVWVSANSGQVEQDTLRRLRRYKSTSVYHKDKSMQTAREMVKCPFSVALRALSGRLSDDERPRAWQPNRCNEFEFGRIASKNRDEYLLRGDQTLSQADKANLLRQIDEFELSIRSANCLKANDLVRVGDLTLMTEDEMLRLPNFGYKSLNELKSILASMGFKFATP